jgi:hypothetical protein
MTIYTAVKSNPSARQTVKQLGLKDTTVGSQLRGYCVHAIGGESGVSLTAARRESIRKNHNRLVKDGETRCPLHVGSWKTRVALQCGRAQPRRPTRSVRATPVAAPAEADPPDPPAPPAPLVPPVRTVPQVALTANQHLRNFMEQLDENRTNMTDGEYLIMANTLQNAHRRIGALG